MQFFESELQKIMGKSNLLTHQTYTGRTCYGWLSEELRAKIQFVTLGISNQYGGIKTTIINRKEGVVDTMLLRFSDIWGRQSVKNPNFKEGIMPSIWTDGGESEWYVFKPEGSHYQRLRGQVEEYLSLFQDMSMEPVQEKGIRQIGE